MKEIQLNNGIVALVDDEDYGRLVSCIWHVSSPKPSRTSYACNTDNQGMHRIVMNAPDNMEVDHIDHNGLNNQKANLRLATHQQNTRNRQKNVNGSSRYKGAYWEGGRKQKWRAQIRVNGKTVKLGYFADEEAAARAYDAVALYNFGEFACVNFPDVLPAPPPEIKKKERSSQYRGVSRLKHRWIAQISVDGKNKRVGEFQNEIDAALAYDRAARQYRGDAAEVNFPV